MSTMSEPLDVGAAVRRVVLYVGTLDPERELRAPFAGAITVMRERPGTLFVVAGQPLPAEEAAVRAQFAAAGVAERLLVTGHLSQDRLARVIRRADVCLSPVPSTPLYDVSTPTKLVEYLAVGRRVVANHLPDHDAVVAATGLGSLVGFSAEGFAQGLRAELDKGEPSVGEVRRATDWVRASRDYRALAALVGAAYDKLR